MQKIGDYLDIKNCSCGKGLIGKLALACEDDILNTSSFIHICNCMLAIIS